MKIEVNDESFDSVVYERLKEAYDDMCVDQCCAVFSTDPKVEKKKLKRLRKSLRHAANWFARPDQVISKDK